MMNLEARQLDNGSYMQGVQLEVDKIIPVMERLQEMLLLPKAMQWLGEPNFELAAFSRVHEGKVEIRNFLNLRIRVPEGAQRALNHGVNVAAGHLGSWLQSIGVAGKWVRYDDEGMLGQMPATGYDFIGKGGSRSSGGFSRMLMPLREDFSISVQSISECLLRYPFSGITFQISADEWQAKERNALNRYAAGERIPAEKLRETLEDGIVCFSCAAWGTGKEALVNAVTGGYASGLTKLISRDEGERTARLLAADPWQIHQIKTGASRYAGILTQTELKRLFHCVPMTIRRGGQVFEPSAVDTEAILAEIRGVIDEKMAQVVKASGEQAQKAAEISVEKAKGEMQEEMSRAQKHTEEKLAGQIGQTRQILQEDMKAQAEQNRREILDEVHRGTEAMWTEMAEKIETGVGRAADEIRGQVSRQINEQTDILSEMLSKVYQDMDELREDQKRLRSLLEEHALLTEEQLRELIAMLGRLEAEHSELKKELLVRAARGAEEPLSQKALEALGVKAEAELMQGGIEQRHLMILRIAMNCIEDKPIINAGRPQDDREYYHPYIVFFGFLYEQLIRTYYHNNVYIPYCRYVLPEGDSRIQALRTDLIHYERGPFGVENIGHNPDDWKWETMANRFAQWISVNGHTMYVEQWGSIFQRMYRVRTIRNKIHEMSVSAEEAYEMVRIMVRSDAIPCLTRQILMMGQAKADFPAR